MLRCGDYLVDDIVPLSTLPDYVLSWPNVLVHGGHRLNKRDIVLDPLISPRAGKESTMSFVINSHLVLSQPPQGPLAGYLGSFADSLDEKAMH